MSLGTRIRQTRTTKGITLQELADRSGLSKGFICQLENDKASPSLQALEKLSAGLGIPIAMLFLTSEEKIFVVRESDRQHFRVGQDGPLVQMLSANRRNLKMMLMEVPPGTGTGGDEHAHEGEECHLVLSGTVKFTQGDHSVILGPGDSLHWNGFVQHRMENVGDMPAKVLCVVAGVLEHVLESCECEDELAGTEAASAK